MPMLRVATTSQVTYPLELLQVPATCWSGLSATGVVALHAVDRASLKPKLSCSSLLLHSINSISIDAVIGAVAASFLESARACIKSMVDSVSSRGVTDLLLAN